MAIQDPTPTTNAKPVIDVHEMNSKFYNKYIGIRFNIGDPSIDHIVVSKKSLVILAMQMFAKNIAGRSMKNNSHMTAIDKLIKKTLTNINPVVNQTSDNTAAIAAIEQSDLDDTTKRMMLLQLTKQNYKQPEGIRVNVVHDDPMLAQQDAAFFAGPNQCYANGPQQMSQHFPPFQHMAMMNQMFGQRQPQSGPCAPHWPSGPFVNNNFGPIMAESIQTFGHMLQRISHFYTEMMRVIATYNDNEQLQQAINAISNHVTNHQFSCDSEGQVNAILTILELGNLDESYVQYSLNPNDPLHVNIKYI